MSRECGLPSSLRLELDAQRMYAAARPADALDLAPAAVISRLPDLFDLSLWGIAAVAVFPQVMFPRLDPVGAVLAALAICLLGPALRPAGARLFAELDRRHGRGVRLTAAQFLLGASTAAVAFLPDWQALGGLALALLCGARVLQGLSMGGAWNDLAARRALGAGQRAPGWSLTIASLAAVLGLVVAGGMLAVLHAALGASDFLAWGWRYPFLISFAINIVGLFGQLRLLAAATPEPLVLDRRP
jgi:MFS family permease